MKDTIDQYLDALMGAGGQLKPTPTRSARGNTIESQDVRRFVERFSRADDDQYQFDEARGLVDAERISAEDATLWNGKPTEWEAAENEELMLLVPELGETESIPVER